MAWTTLTLQVTTPLFNGGADPDGSAGFRPDPEAGIRVASIRGAMRFWFRALAGVLTGPDLPLLAALERRVFGGVSGQHGNESAVSSPLILRLPDPPRTSLDASFLRSGRWLGYLLGLGLMKPERGEVRLLRPYVRPGGDPFELKIRFAHDRNADPATRQAIEVLAFASLWLTCAYGGLGARTRRGFGGLRIVDASGDLPRPWSPKAIQTPGLGLYESGEWLWPWSSSVFSVFQQHLRELIAAEHGSSGEPDQWTEPPPYPVLSRRYSPTALAARPFGSWEAALDYAGQQLRLFRANRPSEENRRRQARVRTAEWDDVINVINRDSADFPLGALGLPVGYHDKLTERKFVVNAVIPRGREHEELRRASPLWLRPVGSGNSWRLFTFAFQTRFLPGPAAARVYLLPDVQATRDGWHDDELSVDPGDIEHLTTQWMNAMRSGRDFTTVIRD
ncbi:MAG: RAMP superfamily CRISPR-associated protein [Streptosporangiaceae bacterium]